MQNTITNVTNENTETESYTQQPSSPQQLNQQQDGVRNAARNRSHQNNVPHTALPQHMRQHHQQQQQQQQQLQQQQRGQMMNQQQQIIDHHDENLSDKEVYPGSMHQSHNQMVNIIVQIYYILCLLSFSCWIDQQNKSLFLFFCSF